MFKVLLLYHILCAPKVMAHGSLSTTHFRVFFPNSGYFSRVIRANLSFFITLANGIVDHIAYGNYTIEAFETIES